LFSKRHESEREVDVLYDQMGSFPARAQMPGNPTIEWKYYGNISMQPGGIGWM
jgi:hypothetical protein